MCNFIVCVRSIPVYKMDSMYVSDVQTNLVGPTQLVLYINTLCTLCVRLVCDATLIYFYVFFLRIGGRTEKNRTESGKCGRTAGFC